MPEPVLSTRDLTVKFDTEDGIVHAVTDVSYDLCPGEVLGVVGESGLREERVHAVDPRADPGPPGRIVSGEAILHGEIC